MTAHDTRLGNTGKTGFARFIRPAHAAVARDLAYALTLADRDTWRGFTTVLMARLQPEERAELARAALLSVDDSDLAAVTAALVPCDGAGPPIPAFDGVAQEAALWASWASVAELKAYAAATFLALPTRDRRAFIAFAKGRVAT
jgi:hypothetical protein